MSPNHLDRIEAHYRARWPEQACEALAPIGPAHRLAEFPAGFRILRFAPSTERSLWTYATCGMSSEWDPQPVEAHLFAPRAADESLVELLCAFVNYHRTSAALDHSHIVNFGRPWLAGSACSRGFLSLPYLDGPELEWLAGEPRVRFLWLIPITEEERAFMKAHGLEALEERFEAAEFAYSDPERESVV